HDGAGVNNRVIAVAQIQVAENAATGLIGDGIRTRGAQDDVTGRVGLITGGAAVGQLVLGRLVVLGASQIDHAGDGSRVVDGVIPCAQRDVTADGAEIREAIGTGPADDVAANVALVGPLAAVDGVEVEAARQYAPVDEARAQGHEDVAFNQAGNASAKVTKGIAAEKRNVAAQGAGVDYVQGLIRVVFPMDEGLCALDRRAGLVGDGDLTDTAFEQPDGVVSRDFAGTRSGAFVRTFIDDGG